jgi:hypothetical protein
LNETENYWVLSNRKLRTFNKMDDLDIENGATDSVGGSTMATLDLDEEEPVHDQLPSLEEYKTNMGGASSSLRASGNAGNNLPDEEDINIHDQLPSAEEVKLSARPRPVISPWQKCLRIIAYVLVLAAIVAAIVTPVVILTNNQSDSLSRPSRITEVVDYLVSLEISTETYLTTPGTPQYEAAMWIADDDAYYMPIPAGKTRHTRFVERYALAVLYYATNGPFWRYKMNFLEPVDVCSWFTNFITTSGTYLRLGVNACGAIRASEGNVGGFLVLRLGLRKYGF